MSWKDILKAPLNPRELAEAQEFAGEEIAEEQKKLQDNLKEYEKLESDLDRHLMDTNYYPGGGFLSTFQYKDYFKPNDPEFKLFEEFESLLRDGPIIEGERVIVVADIERARELYEEIIKIPASRMKNPHVEYVWSPSLTSEELD